MSCTDTNPCHSEDYNSEDNPCYENCGCLNPTTFACVSSPGTCDAAGITSDMNGLQVVSQICSKLSDIDDAAGKTILDGDDTCPDYLANKLEAGLNISFTQVGTGCSKRLVINATEGGVPVDELAKVSSGDTTAGYLNDKLSTGSYLQKTITNPASDEVLKFDVVPSTLISTDAGNQLTLGTDGGLKTSYTAPDGSETKVVSGTGINVSGTGIIGDPYVIYTNASILAARSCFDGVWRAVTLVATGNSNVVYVSGAPQYRYRFDGSIEFKGQLTYTVAFGDYSLSTRKYTITVGNIPTSCVTIGEQAGTSDLKAINYIDVPQASADQITQLYGYIIRKSTQNIIIEFQSSFTSSTSKTIVVNFDGVISHPNF